MHLPEEYHLDHPQFNKETYDSSSLQTLEEIHTILDSYMWLAQKFEHNFPETNLCFVMRNRVCDLITQALKTLPKHQIFEEQSLFSAKEQEEREEVVEIII